MVKDFYLKLSESPFKKTINYADTTIEFFFSKDLYFKHFNDGYVCNRVAVADRMFKRYKYRIRFDIMSDLYYYTMCEKHGFYIKVNGREVTSAWHLELTGEKLTLKG